MQKSLLIPIVALLAAAAMPVVVQGQNIERGKFKSLDLEKKILVVSANGQDRELVLMDQIQVLDARGNSRAEKLADFKPGVEMQFVAIRQSVATGRCAAAAE